VTTIEPTVDIYGRYARASALADYLEVLALNGLVTKRALLSDYINDSDWNMEELVVDYPQSDSDDLSQEETDDAADRVFALLEERSSLLGDAYPFAFRGSSVRLKARRDAERDPYTALLATTVLHSYQIPTTPPPTHVFEETVTEVMRGRIDPTVCFSRIRAERASFSTALVAAGAQLDLAVAPGSAPTKRYAVDEKADTLSHLSWGDRRPGNWTYIGQVTCAKSERWDEKLCEPSASSWGDLLNVMPSPLCFLAVPHHVEWGYLHKLVNDRQRIVIDRLRLAKFKGVVSPDETSLVRALLDLDPEPIY
jgi:hypothetical protein